MSGWEENEISKNSQGGTELTKRTLQSSLPEDLLNDFQIIPSRVRQIEEDKIRILHVHDLPEDPELNHLREVNSRNRFHKVVFSSNWQLNEFCVKLGYPQDEKTQVIETPLEVIDAQPKSKDEVRLIYFSTPQRGLELLVPVFEELSKKHDNIHLDVFSSFLIYGWKEMDEKFNPLYDRIRNHPKMTYHGFGKREDLIEHLKKAHILAYPSVWKETSCRVLQESMSAGLMCVHSNLGALPDTSGGLTSMYQYHDDPNKHANVFYQILEHAVDVVNTDDAQKYLRFVKAYADTRFNLPKISEQWKHTLTVLKQQYPDIESRKIPGQVFLYKTT
jgi:glycosyltransferase involved in cell wall biosynthesis